MNILFKKLDINNSTHLESLVKWENDPEINYLIHPRPDATKELFAPKIEDVRERHQKDDPNFQVYMIYDDDKLVGNFSLRIDPGHLYKKIQGTSWLGLTIGEEVYRGRGVAKKAMEFFERESVRLGLNRVELGVFEFNERAHRFYQKLGYQEIGRIKDFTFWNEQYWSDIRMEKRIK